MVWKIIQLNLSKDFFLNLVKSYSMEFFRTPRDGGCNNGAFSVFAFLAFLLAAANLFMMERRKKRDVNTE